MGFIRSQYLNSYDDRRNAVTMFGELLEHLGGSFYFIFKANPPDGPRQNHSPFPPWAPGVLIYLEIEVQIRLVTE